MEPLARGASYSVPLVGDSLLLLLLLCVHMEKTVLKNIKHVQKHVVFVG